VLAKERAKLIVDRFRESLIHGKKENIEELICFHIQAAEEAVIQRYLDEQIRLEQIKEARRANLEKARQQKNKKRTRKDSH